MMQKAPGSIFKLLDSLLIFDTSATTPFLPAKMVNTKLEIPASNDTLPDWFIKYLTEILTAII